MPLPQQRRPLAQIIDEQECFLVELRDVRAELEAIEGLSMLKHLRHRLELRREEIAGHLRRLDEEFEASSR